MLRHLRLLRRPWRTYRPRPRVRFRTTGVQTVVVGGSYLPSEFVGQPVGIDQVGDVWIGDSGATSHMARSADLMYDTRPPFPHRSRIILGNGLIKKVHFVGNLDLVFHSKIDYRATLHHVSFVPDLGFNLFSFHVVHE